VSANTLFLRLEGPLQAWGDPSRFDMRRSMAAPTKSGVLGLVCSAMGLSRSAAAGTLGTLTRLRMGVRVDRPGERWWDWHTVGAGVGVMPADGKEAKRTGKPQEIETRVSRREYLADASVLVALWGDPGIISQVAAALARPARPVYLGRRSCPPSVPVFIPPPAATSGQSSPSTSATHADLAAALASHPWRPRYAADAPRDEKGRPCATVALPCLLEWPTDGDTPAPESAETWYDNPVSFDPPVHAARLVTRADVTVAVGAALQHDAPPPSRPRADYRNSEYRKRRDERLEADRHLCVFCKSPCDRPGQGTVQHVTYRRAGGQERLDDLRALCRLCHDAVTMIEYGLGMGLDRIDPCDPRWRTQIVARRDEIVRFRSLEHRRRQLQGKEDE